MSDKQQWESVDNYIEELLLAPDAALEGALSRSSAAGLPAIQVSRTQGKLLHLLARSMEARRILEIGTLGGYSTIWLARALPQGGELISLEVSSKHAEVAAENIKQAGLSDKVSIRLGQATESLQKLIDEKAAPFDFIFIDANKENTDTYFSQTLELARPGAVIIVDNVVRGGQVADSSFSDPDNEGVRRFNKQLAKESRVSATEIQTVGSKGYDGFALAFVLSESEKD